jgi:hypothetical protein
MCFVGGLGLRFGTLADKKSPCSSWFFLVVQHHFFSELENAFDMTTTRKLK